MNWLQKICQKSMPVPFDKSPEVEHGFYEYPQGFSNIDEIMTQETADQQRSQHQPEYLGAGDHGLAVIPHSDPDKVIKYTDRTDEVRVAMRQQRDQFPYLAKVYSVDVVQDDPRIWAITIEKVKKLEPWQRSLVLAFDHVMDHDFEQEFYDMTKYYSNLVHDILQKHPESKAFLKEYFDLNQMTIEGPEFHSEDVSDENIGINSEGKLVLFDFGYGSWQNPPY